MKKLAILIGIVATTLLVGYKNTDNVWIMGDSNPATNKELQTGNGRIRWNGTAQSLEFSKDGGFSFKEFGSGTGGAAGVNILSFPDAENLATTGWTASGGTLTVTQAAVDVAFGGGSYSWDASSLAQTVTHQLETIPSGLKGRNCLARIHYRDGGGNYSLFVQDGTSKLGQVVLPPSSVYRSESVSFVCPSTGSLRIGLEQTTAGDPPAIFFDNAHLGENFLVGSVNQAVEYGRISYAGASACTWSITSNDTFVNFPADTDCPAPTTVGDITAPGTKIPAVVMNNMPPGKYLFIANGSFNDNVANSTGCAFRFSDGTLSSAPSRFVVPTQLGNIESNIIGAIEYTTAGSRTINLQATGSNANETCEIVNTNPTSQAFSILVYRYPGTSELAYRPDLVTWRVDANISGANPSLGTVNETTYKDIANPSLTMVVNPGSIAAEIACASGTASSGTTCTAADEVVGIAFNPPTAGDVLACVSFGHQMDLAASGDVTATFQIVETTNTSSTIVQESKSRITSRGNGDKSVHPYRLCGPLNFASIGKKTLRLQYEQGVAGTINSNDLLADAAATVGQRDVHWEIYPINQHTAAPVLVGSVTSPSSGAMTIIRGSVTPGVSSCAIGFGEGFSVSDGATGVCNVNFTNPFSGTPACTAIPSGNAGTCGGDGISTTTASIIFRNTSFVAADGSPCHFICIGPK